jgi:hypothetical protein
MIKTNLVLLSTTLFLCASVLPAESKDPVYDCKNLARERIDIYLEGQGARVVRSTQQGKVTHEWVLPQALAFDDKPREPLRYLFSHEKNSFEIREQTFREVNPQELRMMLIQEGEVLTGWQCFYHGAQLKIKMLESLSDASRADLLLATRAVKGFVNEEKLSDQSVAMLLQLIERYSLWGKKMDTTQLRKLLIPVFQPVVYLSPSMVKQVSDHLDEAGRTTWNLILSEENVAGFALIQRWIFWVGLAPRNNNEAVRAGIRGFVKSPLFQDQNMHKFFQGETKSALKSISLERMRQITQEGLTQTEKAFLEKIWKERDR